MLTARKKMTHIKTYDWLLKSLKWVAHYCANLYNNRKQKKVRTISRQSHWGQKIANVGGIHKKKKEREELIRWKSVEQQLYVETLRKRHKTNWRLLWAIELLFCGEKRKSTLRKNTRMLTSAKVIKWHDSHDNVSIITKKAS